MAVPTIYRLAEQAFALIEGGDPAVASSIGIGDLKISCGQVINSLLKTTYINTNIPMGEMIPNNSVLGLYEDIEVVSYNGKSKATLPIKPLGLPRNMGVFAIYPKYRAIDVYDLDNEFIPLQMGQGGLLKSQPLINDLLGQIGYEVFGTEVVFTKDIKLLFPEITLAMRLAIMDISQYGDYDLLPILPEHEWEVITQVYKMYSTQPIPDKVVEATAKEQKNIPLKQQSQS
jgi:hypothetical protein